MSRRSSAVALVPGAGGGAVVGPTAACVLVAHGTRDDVGTLTTYRLAELVRERLPGVEVLVALADVRQPDVTSVLRSVGAPAVVVPVFLAAGYHVRVDIPEQVRLAGTPAVITPHLGEDADGGLVDVAHERLVLAGWRPGDDVVLAAAGSADERALDDVRLAARLLAARVGTVHIGYVATTRPRLDDVVRTRRPARVAVASWLLAPGLFHRRATMAGAAVVASPLGAHPRVADLVAGRYTTVSKQWVSHRRPGLGQEVADPR